MKLGQIITVTSLVGCMAGDITEGSTQVTDNGGLMANSLETIAVKCDNGYAQTEYPGLTEVQVRQVSAIGDGTSAAPPCPSREIAPEQIGRVVRAWCQEYSVINFQRILK